MRRAISTLDKFHEQYKNQMKNPIAMDIESSNAERGKNIIIETYARNLESQ